MINIHPALIFKAYLPLSDTSKGRASPSRNAFGSAGKTSPLRAKDWYAYDDVQQLYGKIIIIIYNSALTDSGISPVFEIIRCERECKSNLVSI